MASGPEKSRFSRRYRDFFLSYVFFNRRKAYRMTRRCLRSRHVDITVSTLYNVQASSTITVKCKWLAVATWLYSTPELGSGHSRQLSRQRDYVLTFKAKQMVLLSFDLVALYRLWQICVDTEGLKLFELFACLRCPKTRLKKSRVPIALLTRLAYSIISISMIQYSPKTGPVVRWVDAEVGTCAQIWLLWKLFLGQCRLGRVGEKI